jgi:hypothetical protein
MGYVLRMSNRNGLQGVHWLYRLLGRDRLNHFLPDDRFAIAALFGSTPAALHAAMVRRRRVEGISVHELHGHSIMKPYLVRPLRPQLCALCIAEFGYVKALWDFSLICACPQHNCVLIDECPACRRKVQWMRPLLHACNCGTYWTEINPEPLAINDAALRVARIVDMKLGVVRSPNFSENALDIALSGLRPDTLMRLLWTFGLKSLPSERIPVGISRVILRTKAANIICERGYQRLAELLDGRACRDLAIQTFHIPSLHSLLEDVDSTDIRFLESLLIAVGLESRPSFRRLRRSLSQLTLF